MFTKKDLKIGYVVKVKNGRVYIIVESGSSTKLLASDDGWIDLNTYNDKLTDINGQDKRFDIIEVYGYAKWVHYALDIKTENRPLLWNREKEEKTTTKFKYEDCIRKCPVRDFKADWIAIQKAIDYEVCEQIAKANYDPTTTAFGFSVSEAMEAIRKLSSIAEEPKIKVGDTVQITTDKSEFKGSLGEVFQVNEGRLFSYRLKLVKENTCKWLKKEDVKLIKEVKREAKKGDYIKIVEPQYSFDKKDDILKIDDDFCMPSVYGKNHPRDTKGDNNLWTYPTYVYVVLEGYEAPKKKVLALANKFTNTDYGVVGQETSIKDKDNKVLSVGDTVELFTKDLISRGQYAICHDDESGYYVMSLALYCSKYNNLHELNEEWYIIKRDSYKDLKVGDIIDDVKVIEKEV